MRAGFRDGAAQLPSVGPRVAGKPDVERLIRRVPVDAVTRGRERPLLVRSRRFRRPDLIRLAQQNGRADDARAKVHVEDRDPEIAGARVGNTVGYFWRLTRQQFQLRRLEVRSVDVAERCSGRLLAKEFADVCGPLLSRLDFVCHLLNLFEGIVPLDWRGEGDGHFATIRASR